MKEHFNFISNLFLDFYNLFLDFYNLFLDFFDFSQKNTRNRV